MKFIKSKIGENHPNYFARVVNVTEDMFSPHPHPDVTKLKRCRVGTDTIYNVLIGIDSKPDKYVFFPSGTQINSEFLRYANLYRHSEMNRNPEKTGLFEDNGRVKSVRLKGTLETVNKETGVKENVLLAGSVSDGFLIELDMVLSFILDNFNIQVNKEDIDGDIWFDTLEHNGKTCLLSKKYVVQYQNRNSISNSSQKFYKHRQKKLKRFDKVIPEQFHFHYDTVNINKCPFVVQPNDFIHISSKWHGTSSIFSYVLCNRKQTWKDKLCKFITKLSYPIKYDYLYASRTVVKNQYEFLSKEAEENKTQVNGYYNCDVWGEAFKVIQPLLTKGMTIYAEICGYLPNNKFIQKGYDYGCVPMKGGEEYTYGKHFKVMVYRITITNVDGIVYEMSPKDVQTWCKIHNLVPVIELYYGKAKDLYPDLDIEHHWTENFWERMSVDKNFYMEMDSPDCLNKVPHEGVVIKIDHKLQSAAFKLKCFKFNNREQQELDKGISNIEDEQSEIVEN